MTSREPDGTAGFFQCPMPHHQTDRILLGHGSGGRLSNELLRDVFLAGYGNTFLAALEDQTILPPAEGAYRLAFTTDSFVVKPLFFPGGDIGTLAINGTVNDLAVGGAIPKYLAAAFILEEGFPLADLTRIVASMRRACDEARVQLVTGDTKVVEHGQGDGVFITTTGIGFVPTDCHLSIRNAQPGDRVLLSGTLGDHGITILSAREGIDLESSLTSDTAPLTDLVQTMLSICPNIRCFRDPTRGGLSSTLHEIAAASQVGIVIEETAIPIKPEVRGACELLGLDPLYVANEGKLVAVVPEESAELLLSALRSHPLGQDAAMIGRVVSDQPGVVTARTVLGIERLVPMLAGDQLPRIC